MAFGAQVFDELGNNMVVMYATMFFLGSYQSSSGEVNFGNPPEGKALKYMAPSMADYTGAATSVNVNINGGYASWSGLASISRIIFYWG